MAELRFRRLGLSPKIMYVAGLLDMCRCAVTYLLNLPEIIDMEVNEEDIIPPSVQEENVKEILEYKLTRYGMARINTWWCPEIDFKVLEKVYKLYYVVLEDGKKYIIDSLTGMKKN